MQAGGRASPIPGQQIPDYLDGTLAGDIGLDPLNIVTKYSQGLRVVVPGAETSVEEADPAEFKSLKRVVDKRLVGVELFLGPNTNDTQRSLMWYREAEIKHGRLAMLAAAGWPLAELWHGPIAKITGTPYALDVSQGRSLSVLNGGLGEVAPFLFVAAAVISAVEIATLDQVHGLTATGMTMKKDGRVVMKSYTPGDLGFDPLGLYGWYGQQMGVMEELRADADPNYALKLAMQARREMETAEIKNGRLAMLAITGFAFQEFIWGTPVVDQTPLFFTFFGDILAPGSTASLGLY
jgi:light-harvesting complex II chlorophyll a/b binding protein 4